LELQILPGALATVQHWPRAEITAVKRPVKAAEISMVWFVFKKIHSGFVSRLCSPLTMRNIWIKGANYFLKNSVHLPKAGGFEPG
jgi:hypothetical protein